MPKLPPIVVAIIFAISTLGPAISALAGVVPPAWVSALSTVVAIAGFLHNWLAASSVADARTLAAAADVHKDLPSTSTIKGPLGRALGIVAGACLLALSGCSWLKANEKPIVTASETIACEIAAVADPAMASVICAGLDALGNVVEQFAPVTTDAATAQAWARRFPSSPAVHQIVVNRQVGAAVKGISR